MMDRCLKIPIGMMHEQNLTYEDLIVYGAICGYMYNVPYCDLEEFWPQWDDLVRWTNLPLEKIKSCIDKLYDLHWLEKYEGFETAPKYTSNWPKEIDHDLQ